MLVVYAAAGGAIGAALRYLVTIKTTNILGLTFPYGTIIVNIIGSLLMGMLAVWMIKNFPNNEDLRAFLAVGVLGGFTTFSAFSLDAINIINRGDMLMAAGYILGSVVFSIIALMIGMWIVRSISL